MKNKKEASLHLAICVYMKTQYPKIIFISELSGQNTNKMQSALNKKLRSSRAFPDIVIYEPRSAYYGLFIEVKKESPFRKDGELKKQIIKNKKTGEVYDHLQEQFNMLEKLRFKGYQAEFVWNFEQAKELIDKYLKGY